MKIAPDKWKHFYVGIGMGIVLQGLFYFLLEDRIGLTIALALFFSFVISYGFELFSKFTGKGHYEVMDAVASVIGASLGITATVVFLSL